MGSKAHPDGAGLASSLGDGQGAVVLSIVYGQLGLDEGIGLEKIILLGVSE